MIIQCGTCNTQFNVDEGRLRPEGSRVRCSVCKSVFVAYPTKRGGPPEEEAAPPWRVAPDEKQRGPSAPPPEAPPSREFDNLLHGIFEESLREIRAIQTDEDVVSPPRRAPEPEEPLARGGEPKALFEDLRGSPVVTEEPPEPPVRRGKNRVLPVVAVLLLVLVGMAAAVAIWMPEWLPRPLVAYLEGLRGKGTADPGSVGLTVETVKGAYVEGKGGGRLFAIRGMVKNEYATPRSHILLEANLLDKSGASVMKRQAYAGNVLTEEEIKTLPMEVIRQRMDNRYGTQDSNMDVPRGKSLPFVIVFENLPQDLAEFTVAPIGSSDRPQGGPQAAPAS